MASISRSGRACPSIQNAIAKEKLDPEKLDAVTRNFSHIIASKVVHSYHVIFIQSFC